VIDAGGLSAKVYVDGELYAFTPVTIPALPAGPHRIKLVADGYDVRLPNAQEKSANEYEVTVSEGQTLRLTPAFSPRRAP
jgi:hypothetical protein